MSDSDQITEAVLRSLREQPTLNTPALIVDHGGVPDGVDQDQVQAVLNELVAAGKVKHRPTGWKLAPEVA